jgi:hypothetical protein
MLAAAFHQRLIFDDQQTSVLNILKEMFSYICIYVYRHDLDMY